MREPTVFLTSFNPVRAVRAGLPALLLTILASAPILHAAEQGRFESMRQSVLALDSARQTALQDIRSSSLSGQEQADYRDFIVYLNTRIVNYCTELAEQGGAATVEGLPCPDAPAAGQGIGSQSPADQPPPPEEAFIYLPVSEPQETHTRAEKTASMDKQLFASLGEFDELLLKEEDKISSRVPSQREAGDNGRAGLSGGAVAKAGGAGEGSGESGDGMGAEGNLGPGSAGAGEAGSSSARGGQAAQGGTASGTGTSVGAGDAQIDHSTYGAPGGKLPPPQDDDIVARQLREAAEKETDPELKKKLWEEYWKYKGVSKGGKTGQ